MRSRGSTRLGILSPTVRAAPGSVSAGHAFRLLDQRIPVGEAIDIIGQYKNSDKTEVEGWDGSVVWAMPETGAGQFTFRGDFVYMTRFKRELDLAPIDVLRRNGFPEWRYTMGLDWDFRGFRTNVTMRYVSASEFSFKRRSCPSS